MTEPGDDLGPEDNTRIFKVHKLGADDPFPILSNPILLASVAIKYTTPPLIGMKSIARLVFQWSRSMTSGSLSITSYPVVMGHRSTNLILTLVIRRELSRWPHKSEFTKIEKRFMDFLISRWLNSSPLEIYLGSLLLTISRKRLRGRHVHPLVIKSQAPLVKSCRSCQPSTTIEYSNITERCYSRLISLRQDDFSLWLANSSSNFAAWGKPRLSVEGECVFALFNTHLARLLQGAVIRNGRPISFRTPWPILSSSSGHLLYTMQRSLPSSSTKESTRHPVQN